MYIEMTTVVAISMYFTWICVCVCVCVCVCACVRACVRACVCLYTTITMSVSARIFEFTCLYVVIRSVSSTSIKGGYEIA